MEEFEARFEIASDEAPALCVHLYDATEAELIWFGVEENVFFDTPDLKLKQNGIRFRLRLRSGLAPDLCFKGSKRRLQKGYKKERETPVQISSVAEALRLISALGLSEIRRYQKLRAHWQYDKSFIEVDRVGGRCFVEIEAKTKRDIDRIAKKLNIDRSRGVTDSYAKIYEESEEKI